MRPQFFCLLIFVASACGAPMYSLPAPPAESEQRSVSLIPGEDERRAQGQYLDVRARVLEVYNLLASKRFDEATRLMSHETRDWLESMGAGASVVEVLAAGKLTTPNGVVDFDPVTTLVANDVSQLADRVEGVEEHETAARKEIFATLHDGKLQKIVLIQEGGQWVLHRTRFPELIDPPKKASPQQGQTNSQ